MLLLSCRRVTDAHWPVAPISGKFWLKALFHRISGHDAIDRLQVFVLRHDGENIGDEILHRPSRAQSVERLHYEISVAQPAVPIVPGAARARGPRGGGGGGGAGRAGRP